MQRINAIIEVDGLTHQWEEVAKKDLIRTDELQQIGFTILRFNDDEVLNDIENVNRTLCFFIEDYLARTTPNRSRRSRDRQPAGDTGSIAPPKGITNCYYWWANLAGRKLSRWATLLSPFWRGQGGGLFYHNHLYSSFPSVVNSNVKIRKV